MRKILVLGLFLSVLGMSACSDDEENGNDSEETDVSLESLSRGQAVIEISGDEEFSFKGSVFGANISATINENEYRQNRVTLRTDQSGDERKVLLYFYIPEALGQSVPPNGDIPVTFDLAGLDETYVAILVEGEKDVYTSNTLTEGTLTVSESADANLSYHVEFDLRKFTSFDDLEINMKGAFKY